MRGLLREHRDGLDARRAGADDGDALAGEIHAFVGPVSGVVCFAPKVGEAVDVRRLRGRDAPGRHDEVPGRDPLAGIRFDLPAARAFVEMRGRHGGVEVDVLAQVEPVGHVIRIGENIRLRREFLRPVPFLLQFLVEGVGVLHALDVAAGTRVAVPVPGAADTAAALEDPRGKPEAAQAMQEIETRKSGADDNRVHC